jgi:hypothetical protein
MASAPQKDIGGRKFSFGTLPATKAVRVEVAIARVIGEPLFKAFMEIKASGKEVSEEEQMAAATAAIGLLTTRMDADELLATMETVFDVCSCDGQPINIDSTFTGKPQELWQAFIEALKVNFTGFFPVGLSASLAGMIKK